MSQHDDGQEDIQKIIAEAKAKHALKKAGVIVHAAGCTIVQSLYFNEGSNVVPNDHMPPGEPQPIVDGIVKGDIVTPGTGILFPRKGDRCLVMVRGDKCKYLDEPPQVVVIGSKDNPAGLSECLLGMSKGEEANFTVSSLTWLRELQLEDEKEATIRLTLMSWLQEGVVDVLENGTLLKKVLRKGQGTSAGRWMKKPLSDVTVHVIGSKRPANTAEAGVEIINTISTGDPLRWKLGAHMKQYWHKDVGSGLDTAVAGMMKGEVAKIIMTPDLAFGDSGADADGSVFEYEIKLLGWVQWIDVLYKSMEFRFNQAQQGDSSGTSATPKVELGVLKRVVSRVLICHV